MRLLNDALNKQADRHFDQEGRTRVQYLANQGVHDRSFHTGQYVFYVSAKPISHPHNVENRTTDADRLNNRLT